MSNSQLLITAILGIFAQPLIALVKDVRWSTGAKTVLALVISFALGAGAVFLAGELSLDNIFQSSLLIFTMANLVYNLILKGSGLNNALEQINMFNPMSDSQKQAAQVKEALMEPAPAAPIIDALIPSKIESPPSASDHTPE